MFYSLRDKKMVQSVVVNFDISNDDLLRCSTLDEYMAKIITFNFKQPDAFDAISLEAEMLQQYPSYNYHLQPTNPTTATSTDHQHHRSNTMMSPLEMPLWEGSNPSGSKDSTSSSSAPPTINTTTTSFPVVISTKHTPITPVAEPPQRNVLTEEDDDDNMEPSTPPPPRAPSPIVVEEEQQPEQNIIVVEKEQPPPPFTQEEMEYNSKLDLESKSEQWKLCYEFNTYVASKFTHPNPNVDLFASHLKEKTKFILDVIRSNEHHPFHSELRVGAMFPVNMDEFVSFQEYMTDKLIMFSYANGDKYEREYDYCIHDYMDIFLCLFCPRLYVRSRPIDQVCDLFENIESRFMEKYNADELGAGRETLLKRFWEESCGKSCRMPQNIQWLHQEEQIGRIFSLCESQFEEIATCIGSNPTVSKNTLVRTLVKKILPLYQSETMLRLKIDWDPESRRSAQQFTLTLGEVKLSPNGEVFKARGGKKRKSMSELDSIPVKWTEFKQIPFEFLYPLCAVLCLSNPVLFLDDNTCEFASSTSKQIVMSILFDPQLNGNMNLVFEKWCDELNAMTSVIKETF